MQLARQPKSLTRLLAIYILVTLLCSSMFVWNIIQRQSIVAEILSVGLFIIFLSSAAFGIYAAKMFYEKMPLYLAKFNLTPDRLAVITGLSSENFVLDDNGKLKLPMIGFYGMVKIIKSLQREYGDVSS